MTSGWLSVLTEVAIVQGLAAMSPGPAFLLVTRASVGRSRAAGIATGLGVSAAAGLWALAATVGAAALLTGMPALYGTIQFGGAVYLVWLGLSAWRSGDAETAERHVADLPDSLTPAALRGFWLSLSNPKIVVFYSSIFVSLIPAEAPGWVRATALIIVVAQEFAWYATVALGFSRPAVQAAYRRIRRAIDRVMGAVFVTMGARIAAIAHF